MNIHTVLHIPTLHGKIFEGIFPMWKCVKLLPSKQTKSNLTFKIYFPKCGDNYNWVYPQISKELVTSMVLSTKEVHDTA